MNDGKSKKPRGFGFVTFEDPACIANITVERYHLIKGRWVEVKRAVPRELMDQHNAGDHAEPDSVLCQLNNMHVAGPWVPPIVSQTYATGTEVAEHANVAYHGYTRLTPPSSPQPLVAGFGPLTPPSSPQPVVGTPWYHPEVVAGAAPPAAFVPAHTGAAAAPYTATHGFPAGAAAGATAYVPAATAYVPSAGAFAGARAEYPAAVAYAPDAAYPPSAAYPTAAAYAFTPAWA